MSDRSVKIGGNATGNIIQTGNRNQATLSYTQTTLPAPEDVDIKQEMAALRALLEGLGGEDNVLIDSALTEADHHLAKDDPEKDRVGNALDRALDYASKAEGYAEKIEKLAPHVKNAAAWLGENWHKLLSFVGLVV